MSRFDVRVRQARLVAGALIALSLASTASASIIPDALSRPTSPGAPSLQPAFGEPGPSGGYEEPPAPEDQLLEPAAGGSQSAAVRIAALVGEGLGLAVAAFGFGSMATAALDGPDIPAIHRGLAFAASGAAVAGLSALLFGTTGP